MEVEMNRCVFASGMGITSIIIGAYAFYGVGFQDTLESFIPNVIFLLIFGTGLCTSRIKRLPSTGLPLIRLV
jgi:hypothetical protein